MKVRMKVGISGGRADGTEWPPAGETLEVGAREGAELCAAHLAEPVAEVEKPAETRPAPEAEKRAAAGPEDTGTPSSTPAPPPPAVNAPKADWVAHAVACGANEAEAQSLSKPQLIERYG